MNTFPRHPGPRQRRGIVLVIVLVVVAVLALAAYTFSDLMVAEKEAVVLHGKQLQSQALVDSGVEMVKQFLALDAASQQEAGGLINNPLQFQGITVVDSEDATQRGKVTVMAPNLDQTGELAGLRYGLEDESTRLNLNTLLLADKAQSGSARTLLMALPGMTEDVADAILDWMDEDEEPREYGAELETYSGLNPPYAPRNGPLETVEELLLVRGVTPLLLFGADVNRNGMIDAHESQYQMGGTAAPGMSSMSGSTSGSSLSASSSIVSNDRGWSAYLTLYSQEKNVNSQGQPRINVNQDDLQQLHEQLLQVFSEEWSNFIVAYRQSGAVTDSDEGQAASGTLDLSKAGQTKLTQVLDLIGAKTRGTFDGQQKVLRSPFGTDAISMSAYLPTLMDNITVSNGAAIPGRININQASRTVLAGIPGMTEELLEQILTQRQSITESSSDVVSVSGSGSGSQSYQHETWLLMQGLVDLNQMRLLLPFVTAGGHVYRAQMVGYFPSGGPAARAEVVIDATQSPPAVLFWRDISHLGRGFALETLGLDAQEVQ